MTRPWAGSGELAVVELVELPLDPDAGRSDVLRLKPDDLTPSHAGEALRHDRDELIIAARQQRRPLGDKDDPECRGDGLFGAAVLRPADPLAPAPALGRRVRWDAPFLDRIGEDEMQQGTSRTYARLGVRHGPFPLLPLGGLGVR